jgi:hypothetical protein
VSASLVLLEVDGAGDPPPDCVVWANVKPPVTCRGEMAGEF